MEATITIPYKEFLRLKRIEEVHQTTINTTYSVVLGKAISIIPPQGRTVLGDIADKLGYVLLYDDNLRTQGTDGVVAYLKKKHKQ